MPANRYRPTALTGFEVVGTIGPLLGGLLAAYFGYLSVFIGSICFLANGHTIVAVIGKPL